MDRHEQGRTGRPRRAGATDRLEAAVRELADALRAEIADAKPQPDTPVALLSVLAAADRLSLSRTTVYEEIAAGRLRSLKVGGRRLIPADAIADYVERASVYAEPITSRR